MLARICFTFPLRFLSNPDCVGIEKVAATDIPESFLERPYTECRALHEHRTLMALSQKTKLMQRSSMLISDIEGWVWPVSALR